mgnify:CR=1 FL=1
MFFKHRVTDPGVTQAWCENIVLDSNLPLLALDEGKVVADLERVLRLEESVLRFLTILAEEDVVAVEAR